jgi:hypothetical protein
MKTLKNLILPILTLFTLAAGAQSVDDIVAKHVESLGGKDKLANLKSVRMESTISVQGMEIPMVITRVNNVGQRVDISAMGMDGYLITTPKAGWSYMPFMGQSAVEPMPEDAVKQGSDELDLAGPLVDYKTKGNKAELIGKETVDGAECFKIKLTNSNGVERTYMVDSKSFYIVRMVAKAFVMGQEQEVSVNYSDYKKTEEGYVFARSISGAFGQGDLTVNKVEVNKTIDEKIFKPSN